MGEMETLQAPRDPRLLTGAEMREFERAEMAAGRAVGIEMMERAGRAVAEAAGRLAPRGRVLVLAGPGNNGGDGYVVARLLRGQGREVEVLALGDPARLAGDAATARDRWGGAIGDWADAPEVLDGAGLVVDALFGTGLTRPVEGLERLAEALSQGAAQVLAVDLPSGLCADSGRALGAALTADFTVTFHAPKRGHFLSEGPAHCGALEVAGIGLEGGPEGVPLVTAPRLALGKAQGHKYSHGHALVLSGGVGKGGAARLAARAALRVGAGAVTLAPPPAALIENAARLDAVMLTAVKDADRLAAVLEDDRLNALCAGPGFGTGPREAEMLAVLLGAAPRPTVLDADALTLLAQDEGLFALLHPGCVLTPHMGEFRRLFPDLADRLAAPALKGPACSRIDVAREAAARAGCTLLLKGPDTVIATPGGGASVHAAAYGRAAPWLATAGAGDVLAGLICGLLARGAEPRAAAETAAFLHVEAARHAGPGLIAEDLPEALPAVLRQLGA